MNAVEICQKKTAAPSRLNRVLWALAGPTLISGLLKATFSLADTYSAGMLSTQALAGLSAAVSFFWMLQSLSYSISMGTLSRVSQAKGAGSDVKRKNFFTQGVLFAFLTGALVSFAFSLGSARILPLLDLTSSTETQALSYLQTLLFFGPAWWVFDSLEQGFRASSDAKTPMLAMFFAALINALLNPALALGWFGLPQLGLRGVALATGISWILGAFLLLWIAHHRGWLYFSALLNEKSLFQKNGILFDLGQTLKIGVPTSLSGAGFDVIWIFLTPLIAQSGSAALAAVAIGHRLEAVGWLMAQGMGGAAGAAVGQSIGAQDPQLARRFAWRASIFAFCIAGLWAALLLSKTLTLYGLFSDDTEVLRFGQDYMLFAAIPMVFQGLEVVMLGAFAGTGRTSLPSALVFVSYALRLPIAYAWAKTSGAVGVYQAIGLTASLAGLFSLLAFFFLGPCIPINSFKKAQCPRDNA